MSLIRHLLAALLLLAGLPALAAASTNLTTTGGQSLSFPDRLIGQYANGDYWIYNPTGNITITRTVPVPNAGMNGCEKNFPGLPVWDGNHAHNGASAQQRTHGFDSRQGGYSATKNSCTTATVVVEPNTTLMIAKSKLVGEVLPQGSSITHYIELVEPVTVVTVQPSAGDFRPGFAAVSKLSPGNKSSIRYDRMLNLNAGTIIGEPTQAQAEDNMRWMIYQGTIGVNQWQMMQPTRNVGFNTERAAYGKNTGAAVVDVLMWLSLADTNAVKETMAVRWIQQGIDIYSQYQAGFMFQNEAGFVWPNKSILLLSAAWMNNQASADAVKTSVVGKHHWDDDQMYFTVTQADIDTPRQANCSDNVHTDPAQCVPFVQGDLGRAWWCDNYYWSAANGSDCSRKAPSNYMWIASHAVPIAFILSKLSLLDEFDNPAYYKFLMGGSTITGGAQSVDPNWFYPIMSSTGYGTWGVCAFGVNSVGSSNGMKVYACSLIANHLNDTPINASLTGGGVTDQPPVISLVSPSSSTSQVQTAATIVMGGTCTDVDGTCTSIAATATCDGFIAASGTPAAWFRTVDLNLNEPCTISLTATDDDGAVSAPFTLSVLRTSNTCTSLTDAFTITGTWPSPNPYCWGVMAGGLTWTGNQLQSSSAARNLFFYNSPVSADQQASITVNFLPDANNWAYGQVRTALVGTSYRGYSCTAQNPTSYIARWDNGVRVQLGPGIPTTWVSGQTLVCKVTGTSICLIQNGVQQGACENDVTYATGFTGAGLWGVGGVLDNYVATSLSGGGDVSPPAISIAVPATDPTLVTATPYTLAQGSATDDVGIVSCVWSLLEFPAVTGTCGGTTLPATSVTWTIASIALSSVGTGANTLQVTVSDAAGHTATRSTALRYLASGPSGTYTYPNVEDSWTQRGRVVVLEGTFQAGACDYVKLANITDLETGADPVLAVGADTWSGRGFVPAPAPGTLQSITNVVVSCMDDNGTPGNLLDDVSLVDRVKVVTSLPNRKRP